MFTSSHHMAVFYCMGPINHEMALSKYWKEQVHHSNITISKSVLSILTQTVHACLHTYVAYMYVFIGGWTHILL